MKISFELSTKEVSELVERFSFELAMVGVMQNLCDAQRDILKVTAGYEFATVSETEINSEDMDVIAGLLAVTERRIYETLRFRQHQDKPETSEEWTGEVVGSLHTNRITAKELAEELGWHPKYLSQVLNGRDKPKGAEEKVRGALAAIIKERKENGQAEG